jgi:hypothetical protein
MNIEPQPVDVEKVFAPAREKLEKLIASLNAEDARGRSHSDTERMLKLEGFANKNGLLDGGLKLGLA